MEKGYSLKQLDSYCDLNLLQLLYDKGFRFKTGTEGHRVIHNLAEDRFNRGDVSYCEDYITHAAVVEWLRVNHNIDVIVLPYFTPKNTKCYHYEITTDGLKEISNQQERFLKVMQASHQDIPGNYIDDDLLEANLFKMGFAFKTPQAAYSAAIDFVLGQL